MEISNNFKPADTLKTPVLLIVFNRLETTKKVFESIRKAKPPRLYIAADGPRIDRANESEKVNEVRSFILENIDWECEVKTLFQKENLGCRYAVSGAITWFFEHEEMGIILEDDCLPSQSFFWFAEEALIKFKDDDHIYGITGDYRAPIVPKKAHSISLISFPLIWGWATWRRVWSQYDIEMKGWNGNVDEISRLAGTSKDTKRYFNRAFTNTANGKIKTWDYQFAFQMLKNNGKFVAPNINMISNIGFGQESTHTAKFNPLNNSLAVNETIIKIDDLVENDYDQWLCKNAFNRKSYQVRFVNKIAKILTKKALIK